MGSSLGIAIDGGRYIRIDSAPGAGSKAVRLRPLSASQRSARLGFYSFSEEGPVLRKTLTVSGLKPRFGEAPRIVLRAEPKMLGRWVVTVRHSGELLGPFSVWTRRVLWPLILGVLLILGTAAALLFLVPGMPFAKSASPQSVQAPRTPGRTESPVTAQPPATPEPPATSARPNATEPTPAPDSSPNSTPESGNQSQNQPAVIESAASPAKPEPSRPDDKVVVETGTAGDPAAGRTLVIEPLTVYFPPESVVLTRASLLSLERYASALPPGAVLDVAGHCAPFGTARGRERLSLARAQVVADVLARYAPGNVEYRLSRHGSTQPVTSDEERQDLNRRVEISPADGYNDPFGREGVSQTH